jgi:hypothetical protein
MVRAFISCMACFVCFGIGLSIITVSLRMIVADARVYLARLQADSVKHVTGDVLLTSFGVFLTVSGITGLLVIMGVI